MRELLVPESRREAAIREAETLPSVNIGEVVTVVTVVTGVGLDWSLTRVCVVHTVV